MTPLRQQLRALLDADTPAPELLLQLVRDLDLAWRAGDSATHRFIDEALARMLVAGAPLFLAAYPRARERASATLQAAEQFIAEPSDENHAAFFRAATDSYPFGPGDGCFAVPELGSHGTPGAGCAGGVGSIAYLAPASESARLLAALRRELGPWLA
ncbi:MAG: hypothetical protein H6710_02585 [Myxococcales bacterium]|nr:hypothetical protein [Myxococcales bacterium]MCB9703955.1 hypothetical protein [Myxococcales bacterium]